MRWRSRRGKGSLSSASCASRSRCYRHSRRSWGGPAVSTSRTCGGPGETAITCELLFHPDSVDEPGFDPADAVGFWDETNRPVWHICELSQAGIASRAYRPGAYSPREAISAAWDREVLRAIGHAR